MVNKIVLHTNTCAYIHITHDTSHKCTNLDGSWRETTSDEIYLPAYCRVNLFWFSQLKARANARNNTQHCWAQQCCLLLRDVSRCGKRLQQVTTCWVFRWEYKGLWDVFHLRRHVDFLFACICVDTWHVVRVRRRNIVGCALRMCCANERNIVGPRFDDRETIEMLALVGSEVWPVSNFIQQLPTSRNNTQQHTTWCANARNMLGPTMLRLVGQQCCERLHGP